MNHRSANSLMLVLLLGTTDSLAGALGTILMFVVVVGIYGVGHVTVAPAH